MASSSSISSNSLTAPSLGERNISAELAASALMRGLVVGVLGVVAAVTFVGLVLSVGYAALAVGLHRRSVELAMGLSVVPFFMVTQRLFRVVMQWIHVRLNRRITPSSIRTIAHVMAHPAELRR